MSNPRLPWRDPVAAAAPYADEPGTLLLLSGGEGRWSYLLRRPTAWLTLTADDPRDPFGAIAALLTPAPHDPEGPPFQGGVAGLAAYELGARLEPVAQARDPRWPDVACGLYPSLLAFDHGERVVHAIGDAHTWTETRAPAARAALCAALTPGDPDVYERAVADVVARIGAGEIFQANIARAWHGDLERGARPFDLLVRLAQASPAPFAAYLRLDGAALVSNSPERFLGVDATGRIETRPIKGTRPRSPDADEDRRLAAELLASAKDRAENLMIVDLMRNDLARVCVPGSVTTPERFRVESFANVHHLVSTVEGRLAPGSTAIDAFRAAFPPGSITGAPKVQAMRVIAGHEPPRGPYCGSLFRAGFDGAFDSSVLIRTAAFVEGAGVWRVEVRAGAGIVADSDPHAERLETETKIAALHHGLTGTPT